MRGQRGPVFRPAAGARGSLPHGRADFPPSAGRQFALVGNRLSLAERPRSCRTRFIRSAESSRSWIVNVGSNPIWWAYSRSSRAPMAWKVPAQLSTPDSAPPRRRGLPRTPLCRCAGPGASPRQRRAARTSSAGYGGDRHRWRRDAPHDGQACWDGDLVLCRCIAQMARLSPPSFPLGALYLGRLGHKWSDHTQWSTARTALPQIAISSSAAITSNTEFSPMSANTSMRAIVVAVLRSGHCD
jgi:hypothetical protein